MPIILAIWKTEIRRIGVPGQSGPKKLQDGISIQVLVCTCHSTEGEKHKIGISCTALPEQKARCYLQSNHSKKGRLGGSSTP
jgi:hypothetical protein